MHLLKSLPVCASCWMKTPFCGQMSEMGKVDYGGGGTIAQYMANRNIDTLDAGVAVLSMHAPFDSFQAGLLYDL